MLKVTSSWLHVFPLISLWYLLPGEEELKVEQHAFCSVLNLVWGFLRKNQWDTWALAFILHSVYLWIKTRDFRAAGLIHASRVFQTSRPAWKTQTIKYKDHIVVLHFSLVWSLFLWPAAVHHFPEWLCLSGNSASTFHQASTCISAIFIVTPFFKVFQTISKPLPLSPSDPSLFNWSTKCFLTAQTF